MSVSRLATTEATPPGSKSVTNRALLLAALAEGESTLEGVLDAEDSQLMLGALRELGIEIDFDAATKKVRARGQGGAFPNKRASLYVGNSGTTARFLAAALSLTKGVEYRIDGKPRMRERPIGDLLRAVRELGADVECEMKPDCPPLIIKGLGDRQGASLVRIPGDVSSQFLSGLLMAAPLLKRPIVVEVVGALASRPYVEMTLAVMRSFGVDVQSDEEFRRFDHFDSGRYVGRDYTIEPDASAASYFFALPAILGGSMTILGLSRDALQGDVAFVDCLERMGCSVARRTSSITVERLPGADGVLPPLRGIDVDMNSFSDVAQTLSVVALFAETPTTIRNVANMRVKETDRIAALVAELRKFGADVQEYDDGLTIDSTARTLKGAQIATYDDHRMAMSFALAGLKIPGVVIENPACVAKTYPDFFEDLSRATAPIDAR